jgi:hypothetical protein
VSDSADGRLDRQGRGRVQDISAGLLRLLPWLGIYNDCPLCLSATKAVDIVIDHNWREHQHILEDSKTA